MMFKRVLLLLLLVAVLVVPGMAVEYTGSYTVPCDSLSEWVVAGSGVTASSGYITRVGTGDASAIYWFPTNISGDFRFVSSVYSHKTTLGDLYLSVQGTTGDAGVYIAYSSTDLLQFRASAVVEKAYSGIPTTISSSVVIAREGDVVTASYGGYSWVYSSADIGDVTRVYAYFYRSSDYRIYDGWIEYMTPTPLYTAYPCTINVYDADSRLPLSGSWDYYVVMQGYDSLNGSASGAFKVVNLPVTSILKPHLLYVTKEGYEMTPGFVAIDVPAGGREIKIYLTPLETTAPDNSSVVTFSVTDIESGAPVHSALVNVDGVAKYVGASGTAWFILPENTSHDWVVSSPNHWPIGGNFTVGVDDQTIAVSLTRKTSDLPRPPLPDLPNFPVIHPSLDPAGFRMQILSVPLLGSLASPLLDTVDSLGVGLNDMATAVLDVLTAPADKITGAVSSVGQSLVDTAGPYLVTSSLLLQVIGAAVSCIPEQVLGLVTFGFLLDIARILLWGPT